MLAALFPRGLISRYERELMRPAVSSKCVDAIFTVLIFDPFVRFYLVSFNIIVQPAIKLSSPGLPGSLTMEFPPQMIRGYVRQRDGILLSRECKDCVRA